MAKKLLQVIFPEEMLATIASRAEQHGCKSSTWVRQIVIEKLRCLEIEMEAAKVNGPG